MVRVYFLRGSKSHNLAGGVESKNKVSFIRLLGGIIGYRTRTKGRMILVDSAMRLIQLETPDLELNAACGALRLLFVKRGLSMDALKTRLRVVEGKIEGKKN